VNDSLAAFIIDFSICFHYSYGHHAINMCYLLSNALDADRMITLFSPDTFVRSS
jgi:hypothetical protein